MVIVTMRQTMQVAIGMVVTVVETTLTPNIVMNVFVINKLECLKDFVYLFFGMIYGSLNSSFWYVDF